MEKLKDFFRKIIQENIVIKRTNIAGSIIMFTLVTTLFMYMEEHWGQYNKEFVGDFWLMLAAFLSLSLMIEIKINELWRCFYGITLLTIAPGAAFVSVEYINNNKVSEMTFITVVLNYLIYLTIYLIIYIISNRIWVAITIGNGICFIYLVINYFVYEFRGTPIRAYDLLAIQTAAGVASGYEMELNLRMAMILLYLLILVLLALKVRWKEKALKNRIIVGTIIIGGLIFCFTSFFNKEFIEKHDLRPVVWEIDESVKKHGMLLDFVAGIPFLEISEPEGYTKEKATQIQEEGAKKIKDENEEDMPKADIIAVMNEAFSDLSVLGKMEVSENYLEYFYSLSENVIRGNLYAPVRGGTTCNSEFEFITGYSCAFLPENTIAYQTVIKDSTYNLGADLKESGYAAVFMHPYKLKGWNRNNVYNSFGFDSIIFLENMDYSEEELYRTFMLDSANYKYLIEEYEKQKESNENVFMFNVTMQNHSGYGWGVNDVQVLSPAGDNAEVNEYLSLINRSDEAFKDLIEYYSQVEQPTIILMFGDHQPALAEFTEKMQGQTEVDDIAGRMEEYCVPFIIWANYDIEEKVYDGISTNYLSLILKEAARQPLTEYQKYLKGLMEQYPVITNMGVKDAAGNWYAFSEVKKTEALKEYSYVQYWNLIDGMATKD